MSKFIGIESNIDDKEEVFPLRGVKSLKLAHNGDVLFIDIYPWVYELAESSSRIVQIDLEPDDYIESLEVCFLESGEKAASELPYEPIVTGVVDRAETIECWGVASVATEKAIEPRGSHVNLVVYRNSAWRSDREFIL